MNSEFKLIAGPCVIESDEIMHEIALEMSRIKSKYNLDFYFKASFDKANRTSISSFRGPGLDKGLISLGKIKETFGFKILTDIHESYQADLLRDIVDVIQIPAYLSRQTDLLIAASKTNKTINIKKAQFMAPWDIINVIDKIVESNPFAEMFLTERGTTFGYNNLVVDMTSLIEMKKFGYPVIFDATHSVQKPGGKGSYSDGNRDYALKLALAASAIGVDGLFIEVHPDPDHALSDSANTINLYEVDELINKILKIRNVVLG